MVISHNMKAMNANRQMKILSSHKAKDTEKLSSGYKINRAADNAAGLSISEKMRKQIRGLDRAARNIEDGIGYVQVADGALHEVHDMLQRINELAVQAANGTNSPTDREHINQEVQQIKGEIERIFVTTSFNERKIWEDTEYISLKLVGEVPVQAASPKTPYTSKTVTNANYDKISSNHYTVKVNDAGVRLSWTGYNGKNYETDVVGWDVFNQQNGWEFQIGDYFKPTDTDLFDSAGNPMFDFPVSFAVASDAQKSDIIAALDNTIVYSWSYTSMSVSFEDTNTGREISTSGASISYAAAYASRANASANKQFDFENGNDLYIEPSNRNCNMINGPNTSSVATAKNDTQPWVFEFDMDGIGRVTGTSQSISYWGNDRDQDDCDYWWYWATDYQGHPYQATKTHYADGNLQGLMAALIGKKGSPDVEGLLTPANGGDCDSGGTIEINFNLQADNDYTYGNGQQSKHVGSYYLRLNVSPSDTEQSILDKIKSALNGNTVIDLQTSSSPGSYYYNSHTDYHRSLIIVKDLRPEEKYDDINLSIHSGANVIDKIPIEYECLRLATLGMRNTNVLTEDTAVRTIDEVTGALQIVSRQRSIFGAYQNRLEHAYAIDKNTSENTQSSESKIRDTNIADQMVCYTNISILEQSGSAILAQANQSNNLVRSLLS